MRTGTVAGVSYLSYLVPPPYNFSDFDFYGPLFEMVLGRECEVTMIYLHKVSVGTILQLYSIIYAVGI